VAPLALERSTVAITLLLSSRERTTAMETLLASARRPADEAAEAAGAEAAALAESASARRAGAAAAAEETAPSVGSPSAADWAAARLRRRAEVLAEQPLSLRSHAVQSGDSSWHAACTAAAAVAPSSLVLTTTVHACAGGEARREEDECVRKSSVVVRKSELVYTRHVTSIQRRCARQHALRQPHTCVVVAVTVASEASSFRLAASAAPVTSSSVGNERVTLIAKPAGAKGGGE